MMKNILAVIGVLVVIVGLFGACSSSSDKSSYQSNYSETYKNDASYRQNVRDIANEFNVSEEEVDRKLNAAADAANRHNGY